MLSTAEAFEAELEKLGFEWLNDELWASEDDRTFFSWEDREGGYWTLTTAAEDARLAGDHLDVDTFRAVVTGFLNR